MSKLNWQDVSDQTPSKTQSVSSSTNPWFGITTGLIGVIAGYILANILR